MAGEPMVTNVMYIKYKRTLDDCTPSHSPQKEQTPNKDFSTIPLNINIDLNYYIISIIKMALTQI